MIKRLTSPHLPRMDSVSVATADMSTRRDDSAGLPAPLPPATGADAPPSRGVASAMLTSWLQLLADAADQRAILVWRAATHSRATSGSPYYLRATGDLQRQAEPP